MQPGNAQHPIGGENLPNAPSPSALDRMPSLPMPEAPKEGLNTGAERYEQAAELRAAQAGVANVANTTTPITPVIDQQPTANNAVVNSTTPVVAADEDLIEKEWVDKAKQIVAETRDDPRRRAEQANALQKDYMKKRFGKDIGTAV